MLIKINIDIDILGYGYHIRDSNGVDLIYSDSGIENKSLKKLKNGDRFIVDWKFKLRLHEGNYNIASVLSIPIDLNISKVEFCDFIPLAVQFSVERKRPYKLYARTYWDNEVKVKNVTQYK